MSKAPHIMYRKHTFLSSVAMGFSAIVITIVVSCTVVVLYTVHLASEKSDQVIALAQGAVGGLPELVDSLPPVLADMLDDHRQPDYGGKLAIEAKLTRRPGPHGGTRTAIEVVNNGDEVVSLLSLRVIVLDENDQLLCESQEWAATPVAADHPWRGPIMPGSRRYFVSSRRYMPDVSPVDELRTEVEITELRVWNGPEKDSKVDDASADEATASAGNEGRIAG